MTREEAIKQKRLDTKWLINKIYDDFEEELELKSLKKDLEIAKLEGYQKAMIKEIRRLHEKDCNCITCKGKNDEQR